MSEGFAGSGDEKSQKRKVTVSADGTSSDDSLVSVTKRAKSSNVVTYIVQVLKPNVDVTFLGDCDKVAVEGSVAKLDAPLASTIDVKGNVARLDASRSDVTVHGNVAQLTTNGNGKTQIRGNVAMQTNTGAAIVNHFG
jgi:hypothetical protein